MAETTKMWPWGIFLSWLLFKWASILSSLLLCWDGCKAVFLPANTKIHQSAVAINQIPIKLWKVSKITRASSHTCQACQCMGEARTHTHNPVVLSATNAVSVPVSFRQTRWERWKRGDPAAGYLGWLSHLLNKGARITLYYSLNGL